jgi:hypothetical protein
MLEGLSQGHQGVHLKKGAGGTFIDRWNLNDKVYMGLLQTIMVLLTDG